MSLTEQEQQWIADVRAGIARVVYLGVMRCAHPNMVAGEIEDTAGKRLAGHCPDCGIHYAKQLPRLPAAGAFN